MNEIFGEENFVGNFVWRKRAGGGSDSEFISIEHEYIVIYAKKISNTIIHRMSPQENNYKKSDVKGRYTTKPLHNNGLQDSKGLHYDIMCPDGTVLKGEEHQWVYSQETYKHKLSDDRIIFSKSNYKWKVYYKLYMHESKGSVPFSILYNIALNMDGNEDIKQIFEGSKPFSYPKPIKLIQYLLKLSTKNDDAEDIILDFFAGSGTTAQAVLELNKEDGGNRKFILVQLPEKCDENSEAYKAGYKTIADIAKERIRRVIKNLTSNPSPIGEGNGGDSTENLFKGANPSLFENAHQLRLVDKTEAEEKLWQCLRNRKIENCKFRRQHPIGKFVADFYCHEKKLVVEVDGGYHNEQEQKEHDEARTQIINEYGITVIRFTNDEILNNLQSVINKITAALKSSEENSPLSKWRGAGGEVGFKVFKLSTSNFKIWRGNEITEKNLVTQLDAFTNPVREGSEKENMLYELILKAGYPLHTPLSIWRGAGGEVYTVNNGELIIALEEMNQKLIAQIISVKPKKVITLDNLFTGNDKLKTNTVLQMRDAEIDFKTI